MTRSPADLVAWQLHWAVGANYFDRVKLLVENGVDINARDNAGRNPIDQMQQNGRRDLAEVLRRHGGDSA